MAASPHPHGQPNAPDDFNFIIGDWHVRHRRLNARLAQCDQWTEFDGQSSARKIMGGLGNLEDNVLQLPEGPYHAAALRSYCTRTGTWSIWWLDSRNPMRLDQPVTGSFHHQVGLFYADDVLDGRAIKVRFRWHAAEPTPRWQQAFSTDGGISWETNWVMTFRRRPTRGATSRASHRP